MSEYGQLHKSAVRKLSLLRRTRLKLALAACAWMLMGAVLLLSGCHHQPIKPCETPQLPTQPALTLPPSSKSYSWNAAKIMKKWQEMLTSGKATQEHYPMLGQGDKNE